MHAPDLSHAWLVSAFAAVLGFSAGCGDDDTATLIDAAVDATTDTSSTDAGPIDWPEMTVPDSLVLESGVRRDAFWVDGATPPPNPDTGTETPSDLNRSRVLRYRSDPPVAPRAVVVAMPGFLGGGPSFHGLAQALVVLGEARGEPIEVWAVDRRSNGLEDLRGLNTAEAAGNPEIAQGYYFGGETVGGERFAGFQSGESLDFVSEWGLAVHVEDLRQIVAQIPESARAGHVFLMGHSLGASFAEAYASWRFPDGTRAVDELAGIILIDGGLSSQAIGETEYREGTMGGLLSTPGVDAIRAGSTVSELPLLGQAVFVRAEIMALRTLVTPEEVLLDGGRNDVLGLLLETPSQFLPPMTNRAAFGFAFDEGSEPLAIASVSIGAPIGPTETFTSSLFGGTYVRPSDRMLTYRWTDAPDAEPPEVTPINTLAHAFADGVSNFAEWYFPARLSIDLAAVAGDSVPEGGYQEQAGLLALERPQMDAPVLAIAAALVGPTGYQGIATRMAPAVGAGRRAAGATRTESDGLTVVDASTLSHIDPVIAPDGPLNEVPETIETFLFTHVAETGTVDLSALD
ncbi:MAG: hypothetical protein AAGF12_10310 [Myxococcota bacterium]